MCQSLKFQKHSEQKSSVYSYLTYIESPRFFFFFDCVYNCSFDFHFIYMYIYISFFTTFTSIFLSLLSLHLHMSNFILNNYQLIQFYYFHKFSCHVYSCNLLFFNFNFILLYIFYLYHKSINIHFSVTCNRFSYAQMSQMFRSIPKS